jgi:hypothetical protein
MTGKPIDLTDQVFGRLTVKSLSEEKTKDGRIQWYCLCECGNFRTVAAKRLRNGYTKSCGCLAKENSIALGKACATHGMSKTPEYITWQHMKDRCLNPKHEAFSHYGGRGIKVCDRWLNSFENFYEDMGPRPRGKTLDRKEFNGNYEPNNCRWASSKEQANNQTNNRLITFNGKTQSVAQWASQYDIPDRTLRARLFQSKWDVERALTTPLAPNSKGKAA